MVGHRAVDGDWHDPFFSIELGLIIVGLFLRLVENRGRGRIDDFGYVDRFDGF